MEFARVTETYNLRVLSSFEKSINALRVRESWCFDWVLVVT